MSSWSLRRREQEIALVAVGIERAIQRTVAVGASARRYIMARRQHLRAQLPRGGQQVLKLDRAIALDAGHRRLARAHSSRRSGR